MTIEEQKEVLLAELKQKAYDMVADAKWDRLFDAQQKANESTVIISKLRVLQLDSQKVDKTNFQGSPSPEPIFPNGRLMND